MDESLVEIEYHVHMLDFQKMLNTKQIKLESDVPDWKIGQWHPRFFSRYKFLRPWNRQFFMGENFRAPGCPCVFRLSMAARLHSARLYHGRHNN